MHMCVVHMLCSQVYGLPLLGPASEMTYTVSGGALNSTQTKPKATRTASSDSLRPTEAMGAACNQSPECVAVAASNLALSTYYY